MTHLASRKTTKEFFRFLIPSIIGCISIAILIVVDGIFIGRGIGGQGLAALSTSVPVFTFYAALGLMIGMGAATVAAIQKGQGDEDSKNKTFTLSLFIVLTIGLLVSILQQVFIDELIGFLGAPDNLFNLVKNYIRILGLFSLFFISAQFFGCFIRNDNNPKLAMIGMAVSGAINIILDYLFIFVFDWGMVGAAFATCISQLGFIATLSLHFISPINTLKLDLDCFNFKVAARIFKAGFPTFLTDISNGVVIFAFNTTLYKVVGEIGVASYGIILNFNYLIYLTYIGISQAAQPMLSINYGRRYMKKVGEIFKLALAISVGFSLVTIIGVNMFKFNIIAMYNNEPNIVKLASIGMPLFFSGTLFMGVNIILAAFFQAVEYSTLSSLITFSRGIVLIVLGLLILPNFLGTNGVWLTILFSEGLTLFLFTFYYLTRKIKLNKKDPVPANSQ